MSQPEIIWKINDYEFELDLYDADTADRYEQAFEKMAVKEKALPKDGKLSEYTRAYCNMFKELYDDLFGKGAGEKILGDKANIRICNEIYLKFLDFVSEQKSVITEYKNNLNERAARYSPNRAIRRFSENSKGMPVK